MLSSYQKFNNQVQQAKRRKIEWKLTFDEWQKIWQDSGHWHARGRLSHQYCMARHDDKGVYELGNVSIITNSENATLRNKNFPGFGHFVSKESRDKIANAKLGKKASKHACRKMSQAQKNRYASAEARKETRRIIIRTKIRDAFYRIDWLMNP